MSIHMQTISPAHKFNFNNDCILRYCVWFSNKETNVGCSKKKTIVNPYNNDLAKELPTWHYFRLWRKTLPPYDSCNTRFFYKPRFFSTQPQCCLTFLWIELQMLLRCCPIHINIIIMWHFLYLLYLYLFLNLGLFISHLCDLFLILIFIFITINRVISWIQTHLFFCLFFRMYLDKNVYEECEYFSNSKSSTSGCCLVFAWFFVSFSLALLMKLMPIKKPVSSEEKI